MDIKQRIENLKVLLHLRSIANDHTSCPECREQLQYCDCVAWDALDILAELIDNDMIMYRDYTKVSSGGKKLLAWECTHNKVYDDNMLMSHPPQVRWICSHCGAKGADTVGGYGIGRQTYDQIALQFANKDGV